VRFAEWLAKEVGVAAVPGSSFFREPVHNLIRFHFAKKEETLREAAAVSRSSKIYGANGVLSLSLRPPRLHNR
jgi:aminotransferase